MINETTKSLTSSAKLINSWQYLFFNMHTPFNYIHDNVNSCIFYICMFATIFYIKSILKYISIYISILTFAISILNICNLYYIEVPGSEQSTAIRKHL